MTEGHDRGTDLLYDVQSLSFQGDHFKVTDKKKRLRLPSGIGRVGWGHEKGSVVDEFTGSGEETGDLSLHLAGGGPTLCLRGG